ncbi:hypothetical protein B0H12DRAFT_1076826 [Mycena haematopus]|nr:hypothetical protein B0H12DRAFT_1076826 [Mycena haematopus]
MSIGPPTIELKRSPQLSHTDILERYLYTVNPLTCCSYFSWFAVYDAGRFSLSFASTGLAELRLDQWYELATTLALIAGAGTCGFFHKPRALPSRPNTPRPDTPPRAKTPVRPDTPRPDTPRADTLTPPRAETPRADTPPRAKTPPRVETPRADTPPRAKTPPRPDTPRAETPPRADTPRAETPLRTDPDTPLHPDTPPRADTPPCADTPPRADTPPPHRMTRGAVQKLQEELKPKTRAKGKRKLEGGGKEDEPAQTKRRVKRRN